MKSWKPKIIDKISGKFYKDDKLLNAIIKNKNPNITFSFQEQKNGQKVLEELTIPKDKDYICFHARDAAYLDSVLPTVDWSYHNYRDSSINNFLPAVEKMTDFGYYGVRMGALVKERINTSNPLIIDYASNGMRTDFNDIYIGGHCHFFICSDGGMSIIPEMFRIPVIYTNWTQIGKTLSTTALISGLVIFKKFYLKKEKRFMNFSEIMKLEFGGKNTNNIFEKLQLELIENTPEEICAVTTEMHERVNDTWVSTEEDEELQKCFWALLGPDRLKSPDLRIGAEYLRENRVFLV
jgi:putative glycosyltransferase (TIGR04372 family)